ncbi:MAG: ATP-binding protein, partial [Dehalococcoidia bacterium]|nr:ATP-binding protein [Dehalococcoidia bacterium]
MALERRSCPIFFAAIERERIIAASDARIDRRTAELAEAYLEPLGIVSMVAVVMGRAGQGKGLMVVEQTGSTRRWTSEEVVFIGAAAQIAALAVETADRRAAEKVALESQKRTAQIIDFLPDAAFVIDREGKVTYWNRAIENMTGVRAQDIVGKGDYEHALAFRGERVPSLADYAMNAPGEIPSRYPGAVNRNGVWLADVYLPKLRGGAWLALAAGLLRDDEGMVVGAIETLRDITAVKETEAALRAAKENADRMNRQLEQAMSHANRMAIEAALANEAKSAFLATMSHEIRTPMNGIIGMTGLLLDTELTPEQRQYAETVRASAEALLGIINDILDFSKIEAGKMELEKTTFNLLDVIEGVVDIVALKAQEKGLELGYVVAPDVPEWLEGDAGRLRQILTNLVGNAIKFTHKGEVAVRVNVKERRDSKVKLYFEVRDTGIGIPEDKLGSLFRPFTQVDASTTRKYGGTGLGLSIARSLAEAMGGEIGVQSVE